MRFLEPTLQRGVSAAAFMVPGLALWLPSGYSWGALCVLVLAVLGANRWWGKPVARSTWWLAVTVAFMASVLLLDFDPASGSFKTLDRPGKYLLALPCLFLLAHVTPAGMALWRGLAVGALGAGCIGLWQVWAQGYARATGYTNEIQYGNLALCLGLMCLLGLVSLWARWRVADRWLLAGGVLMGLLASVLSQSRGGWLALLVLLPVLLWLALRWLPNARVWRAVGALGLGLVLVGAAFHDSLRQRTELAWQEVQAYENSGEAGTSIGQRLAHWQLAWRLGLQKPWLGWGSVGYAQEKHLYAERGEVSPFVAQFNHAHNDLLDAFVRRGLLGVVALMCFYAVPLAVFWPTRQRLQCCVRRDEALALRLVGVCLVMSYVGFGFTQVFFAHNSGNLFYVFMMAILHGMLLHTGNGSDAAPCVQLN